jgi:cyclopropane fatty-acyl-phospholipid synthase-like methyltransferase
MAVRPNSWTKENLRHVAALFRQGRNPAARVYESIGSDFFLVLAPGWLNLGLWEGPGSELEAEAACRRLVERLAASLPKGGVVLDVGNGLGTQDPVISAVAQPRTLVALNITEWQLHAGRAKLQAADASPVAGDACRLPMANRSLDGVISVEAAFHFASRRAFFEECVRVLRPGGVLTMSDISAERLPRGPLEAMAGVTLLRAWGMNRGAAMPATEIAQAALAAGLTDVEVTACSDRVIGPALRLTKERLLRSTGSPLGHRTAARAMLSQVDLLWQRGMIEYLLLRAVRP